MSDFNEWDKVIKQIPLKEKEIETEKERRLEGEACPKCKKFALMTDNDTVWCEKCDYEHFL